FAELLVFAGADALCSAAQFFGDLDDGLLVGVPHLDAGEVLAVSDGDDEEDVDRLVRHEVTAREIRVQMWIESERICDRLADNVRDGDMRARFGADALDELLHG